MLPDDVFRSRLRELIAAIRSWSRANADVALSEEAETPSFWRIAVSPHAENACAFELILHFDQRYDLVIEDETYEGRRIERLGLFEPMIAAIATGNVLTRIWTTPATGALHSVESIIDLEVGTWSDERLNDAVAALLPRSDCLARDRHYAPYLR